jgi:hypothetical protein
MYMTHRSPWQPLRGVNPEQEGKTSKKCATSSEVVQAFIRKCPEKVSLKSSLDTSEELDIFWVPTIF